MTHVRLYPHCTCCYLSRLVLLSVLPSSRWRNRQVRLDFTGQDPCGVRSSRDISYGTLLIGARSIAGTELVKLCFHIHARPALEWLCLSFYYWKYHSEHSNYICHVNISYWVHNVSVSITSFHPMMYIQVNYVWLHTCCVSCIWSIVYYVMVCIDPYWRTRYTASTSYKYPKQCYN